MIFVFFFQLCHNKWKIDDVLGVWPLHGLCGLWVVSPPVSSVPKPWAASAA